MSIHPGVPILTMADGVEVDVRNATNHSIRLLWGEREGDAPALGYEERLIYLDDATTKEQYSVDDATTKEQYSVGYSGSGTRVVIETAPHWELAITEIRCSNPWGALVAIYQEKPMQVAGEHIELLRPWRFREHLSVSFEYRAANRKIWPSKDAAPRSAMIILSGLLIQRRL